MFLFLMLGEEPTFVTVAPERRITFERKNPQTAVALSERVLTDEEARRIMMHFMKLYDMVRAQGSTLVGREVVTVAACLFLQRPSSPGHMAA